MASKLTKKINARFNPTLLSGYPVYAAGGAIDPYSMMMQQGQQILSSAGTGMDNYFTNKRPEKANLGSAFFSNYLSGGMGISGAIKGIGAVINRKGEFEAQQDLQSQQQQEAIKSSLISNLPAQHYYQPTFAMGGKISPSEIAKGTKEEMEHTSSKKVSRKTAMDHLKEDPKYYTKLKKAGLADSYAGGGMLNSYANGGNLDNTTVFQGGGSHQENQLGGIPQGTNALVEEGEVRFKDYIFSNRIPYTKKK